MTKVIKEASVRISARSEATLRFGALSGDASDRLESGKRCVALISLQVIRKGADRITVGCGWGLEYRRTRKMPLTGG